LLVRVSRSRSNSDREVEKLMRNGVAESTQEIERQRPVVRGSKGRDRPPFEFRSDRHCRIRRDLGSLDQSTGEQGASDEKEAMAQVTTVISH
jgi:hypothetical protein